MLCARPDCRRAAASIMRVDGRDAARVCSQRCGYELIGMPKRAADDDDAADAGRDAAFRALQTKRTNDRRRFKDMATMATKLVELSNIRARPSEMREHGVMMTTMAICRRIDNTPGSTDMERRIDAVIADAIAVIEHINKDEPYDMDIVCRRITRLRDDIVADHSLDAFDASPPGAAAIYMGVPDELRQLMAYRTRPVQQIAQYATLLHYERMIATMDGLFFENQTMSGKVYYLGYNSKELNVTSECRQKQRLLHVETVSIGPQTSWTVPPQVSPPLRFEAKNGSIVIQAPPISGCILNGKYLAILDFSASYNTDWKCRIYDDSAPNNVVADFTIPPAIEKRISWFALDPEGRLWHRIGGAIRVVNLAGVEIARFSTDGQYPRFLAPGRHGVWVGESQSIGAETARQFTCYRIVPDAEYNAGL